MSRLSTLPKDIEDSANGRQHKGEVWPARKLHILSVGPIEFGCMLHDALLDRPNARLSIAPDYREMWETPQQDFVQVAILHNTLSSSTLEDACRFIRRRWPYARILVLRSGESFLEDALYDERLEVESPQEVLLAAIGRHSGGWTGQVRRQI